MGKKQFLKKLIAVMIVLALLLSSVNLTDLATRLIITANAATVESGKCGDGVTWTLSNGILTIDVEGVSGMYSYDDSSNPSPFHARTDITSVVISKGMNTIGDYAFSGCTELTSIEIPDGLEYICDHAFLGCAKLKNINIPTSVTHIGPFAFSGCSSLTNIVIPEGVTSISRYAFEECSSLTDVTIPKSVTTIFVSAFYGCSSLTDIVIPESVTTIEPFAFYGCSSLTSIKIPKGVTDICGYTFYNCSNLTSIEIPATVTSIYSYAFSGCSSLTNIEIPSEVTNIESYVFWGCSSLTNIEIPSGITRIGAYNFSGCSSLTSIEIPSGVTIIDSGAFFDCNNLTSIVIPESIIRIGSQAFSCCESLVLYGYSYSYAEQYAKENNIPFISLFPHDASSHVSYDATEATCMENGYTAGVYCTKCEAWISGHEVVTATGHTYKTTTTKATTSKNGSIITKCSSCGDITSKTTIYRPKAITLSSTSYTYDGKIKTPSVTVKNSAGNTLINGTDYTVTYASNRKNVGTYKVTIEFKKNYSGTITRTFNINPPTTTISKITAKTRGFTVKWAKRTTQVTGYQIQYSTANGFSNAKTVTVSKKSTTSKTISKLTKNRKYYVRIRTYKTINGKKYYSSWSTKKNIKTK